MFPDLRDLPFESGERILFQGDSLTAADRDRSDPDHLGHGYVAAIRGILAAGRPDLRLELINRGVGGNRTAELLDRWEEDCILLRPTWLSLMIGVNDVWRLKLPPSPKRHIPLAEFTANYRRLLDRVLEAGPTRLILISPTLIETDLQGQLNRMVAEYDAVVEQLAEEYDAIYVPLRRVLVDLVVRRREVNWLRDPQNDGCHFNAVGHAVAATTWLSTVCGHGAYRKQER